MIKLAYLTDHELPRTSTDTEQFMSMINGFSLAGAEVTLFALRNWLKSEEFYSKKKLSNYYQIGEYFNYLPVKSLISGFRGLDKLLYSITLSFYLRKYDFDILYTRNVNIALCVLLFTHHKLVFETYKFLPESHPFLRPLLKWMLNHKRFVKSIFHSELAKKYWGSLVKDKTRLMVSHNGVDRERFKPILSMEEAREKLGLEKDKVYIAYSGRVTMEKGLDLVLEAAPKIPNVNFLIIGSEKTSKFELEARKYPNITIIPWMNYDELIPYLYASNALLIPPSSKPLKKKKNTVLPMKLFLYLSVNRPIIVPNTEDNLEIISEDSGHYLVNKDDLDHFIQKLTEISNTKFDENCSIINSYYPKSWEERAKEILSVFT